MSKIPTLMHGNDGEVYDLELYADVGRLVLGALFKEISDTLAFKGESLNGTINNLNLKASGSSAPDFSQNRSFWLCDPTFSFNPSVSYSAGIKAKGLGDSVVPLIESMKFKENLLSQPDSIGLATETVRYSFNGKLNLGPADFRFTSNININGNIYAGCRSFPGSWAMPSASTSIAKNIRFNNKELKTPSTHPLSFTLALTIPSFNKTQEQLTKSKDGVSYSTKSYPEISGIKIENLKLNNLFSSIIDNNSFIGDSVQSVAAQAINNTSIRGGLLNSVSLGYLTKAIEGGLKAFSSPVSYGIKNKVVSMMKDMLEGKSSEIETTVNETLQSEQFTESVAFQNLVTSFRDNITAKTWRSSEYPLATDSTITPSVQSFDNNSLFQNQNSNTVNTESNVLEGTRKNDILTGGNDDDILIGMEKGDLLIGGGGQDIFRYTSPKHSRAKKNRLDLIDDFSREQADQIDVSSLHDNLIFISKSKFSNKAGEVRFQNGLLSIDLSGNGASNFDILIDTTFAIQNNDLILN
jgi:hypothetical protein